MTSFSGVLSGGETNLFVPEFRSMGMNNVRTDQVLLEVREKKVWATAKVRYRNWAVEAEWPLSRFDVERLGTSGQLVGTAWFGRKRPLPRSFAAQLKVTPELLVWRDYALERMA